MAADFIANPVAHLITFL